MKIALGADPLGVDLKNHILKYLETKGHETLDLGSIDHEHLVNYVAASHAVAESVQNGIADRGIVFCGTGMGVSIVANKHKGIYCALVESAWAAHECRDINNANMLAMGQRIIGFGMAQDIVDVFLNTKWNECGDDARQGRLQAFSDQITELEKTMYR